MPHRVQGSFFMAGIMHTSPADTHGQQEYCSDGIARY